MALLPSDPKQQRLVLAAVVPIIAAVAYWYFFHGDRVQANDAQQAVLEQLETKNAAAKALAARGGPELKKKLALYEQHIGRLEELIPRNEEVPELLHDITLRAVESGVELNLLRPETDTPMGAYTRKVYSMSLFGPYDGVGRFLSAIGSLPRIVTPVHMKIIPRNEKDRSGAVRLQSEFQIMTYIAPEPGKTAPPVPAKTPVAVKGAPNARG